MKTLAARGIGSLGEMMKTQAEKAPLHRNIDVNEVAATAVFLASDGGSGITGETIYVDCGYNIMGFEGAETELARQVPCDYNVITWREPCNHEDRDSFVSVTREAFAFRNL